MSENPKSASGAGSEPIVETSHGKVSGRLIGGVYVFKGLRYAASTAGNNRFMPPQEPQPWTGARPALAFGASAPQTNPTPRPPGARPKIILSQLPRPSGGTPAVRLPEESEDCLFLNVWTAGLNDGRRRPVMVFGVSGGGMKTACLMASPRAQGLFHRAAVQSGPGLRMIERDQATRAAEMLLRELDLTPRDVGQLESVPLERLMAARFAVDARLAAGRFTDLTCFAPVIDPDILPRHPFSPDASPRSRRQAAVTPHPRDALCLQ